MDADVVASFQFTGQDIPWLLAKWAEAQPDTPLLIWEPKEGEGARWTYGEFQTAHAPPGRRPRCQGHHQGRQSRHPLRQLPRDGVGLVRLRFGRRGGGDDEHTQCRCRDELLRPADRRGCCHHSAAVRGDGCSGGSRIAVGRRHGGQQWHPGQRRGGCARL